MRAGNAWRVSSAERRYVIAHRQHIFRQARRGGRRSLAPWSRSCQREIDAWIDTRKPSAQDFFIISRLRLLPVWAFRWGLIDAATGRQYLDQKQLVALDPEAHAMNLFGRKEPAMTEPQVTGTNAIRQRVWSRWKRGHLARLAQDIHVNRSFGSLCDRQEGPAP